MTLKKAKQTALSPHFTLEEMTFSQTGIRRGLKNIPNAAEKKNLGMLCLKILEPFRKKVGPLRVTSGFRSEAVNRLTGGVKNSQHRLGQAADVGPIKTDLKAAHLWLVDSGIPFDQAIYEFGRWIHVSWSPKPRGKTLVAVKRGEKTVYAGLVSYGRNKLT